MCQFIGTFSCGEQLSRLHTEKNDMGDPIPGPEPDPNPDPVPIPLPDEPPIPGPPIEEPSPIQLPDEAPLPNPDEVREPPKYA